MNIVPVILSGGVGERLWPASRPDRPKQFLNLTGEESLLVQTVRRFADPGRFAAPIIIANVSHRFLVAEQMLEAGLQAGRIVLEPQGRNTAPAIAVAALIAAREDPEALILVAASDHWMPDATRFLAAVDAGVDSARAGSFVLFGVRPTYPATGFGYIQAGEAFGAVRRVRRFVEKPDEARARQLLEAADHLWNSGIFLMSAQGVVDELEHLAPQVLAGARAALDKAQADADFLRLDADAFAATPSISIDYAVMEKTDRAVVLEADFLWSDVGSWAAVFEMLETDAQGCAARGPVAMEGAVRCFAWSDGPPIGLLGVRDLIVVATSQGVLVATKEAEPLMRSLVARLKRAVGP
ncbi:MAG: mannose-1-phosphate guanylyltransferase/mannose-6-phosphate isomerase [Caulobacterales bacterium]